jgi:hypothetical protein
MVTVGGQTHTVPGAYGTMKVSNAGASGIPRFNGLLIIGNARQGIPYTAGKGNEVIKPFVSASDAKKFHGYGDIITCINQAKLGGAGTVFTLTPAKLTRVTVPIKDSAESTIFNLSPAIYGASGNDARIKIAKTATDILVDITPVKYSKFITADIDVAGTKTIPVEDIDGVNVGDLVYLEDNNTTTNYTSAQVVEIDKDLKRIIVDTTITSLQKAKDARLFKQNIEGKKSKLFAIDTTNLLTKIMDFINSTGVFVASRDISNNGDITLVDNVDDFIGKLVTLPADLGASPVATATDYNDLADELPKLLEEYTNFTKNRIRILLVASPDATVHAKYLALSKTLRSNQYSILVITGADLGDADKQENDVAHPINRARALNSGNFHIAGFGYDDLPAYLSLAPQVAGIISGNPIKRNLTKDTIIATKVEKFLGEYNKETETSKYVDNGVLTISSGKNGFYITQGVNTYQKHDSVWNEDDADTYLIQQRQIADYVFEGFREEMEAGAGEDDFDEVKAMNRGIQKLDKYLAEGVITDRSLSTRREGNSIKCYPSITPIDATDFVGFEMEILLKN